MTILNLRQCVDQRREFINDYRVGEIDLQNVERYAPVSADIMEHVDPIFFGDPKTAAMKVLGGAG
ncbi:MAG: hypothetical protein R3A52_01985 [Polyangiales bacterium]